MARSSRLRFGKFRLKLLQFFAQDRVHLALLGQFLTLIPHLGVEVVPFRLDAIEILGIAAALFPGRSEILLLFLNGSLRPLHAPWRSLGRIAGVPCA